MKQQDCLKALREFMESSKHFNGIMMHGCYTMPTSEFLLAFEEYLKTGNNELDSHAEMNYYTWDASETFSKVTWDKETIKKVKNLLNNKGFWNIHHFWDQEEKNNVNNLLIE